MSPAKERELPGRSRAAGRSREPPVSGPPGEPGIGGRGYREEEEEKATSGMQGAPPAEAARPTHSPARRQKWQTRSDRKKPPETRACSPRCLYSRRGSRESESGSAVREGDLAGSQPDPTLPAGMTQRFPALGAGSGAGSTNQTPVPAAGGWGRRGRHALRIGSKRRRYPGFLREQGWGVGTGGNGERALRSKPKPR